MSDGLGIYVSVPFCRAKCTYCNFASGVFGPDRMDAYVERLCVEIGAARDCAARIPAELPETVGSVYFGGGTPSLLSGAQIRRVFTALRDAFRLHHEAEITLECAPGQLDGATLDELLRQGLNRISFGVQSFVDREAQAVGRSHTRRICLDEIGRIRDAGVPNINVDLIAGLPHQTAESWRESVDTALETGVPHLSVYMLEVDEDSRLGREMLGAGKRYGAATTPSEDETADFYAAACDWLDEAGVAQYEISNFARAGFASRHNLRYWRREPYVGFGLDAHSMLRTGAVEAVRWANTDVLDSYLAGGAGASSGSGPLAVLNHATEDKAGGIDRIALPQAFEETLFLGLRMNRGVDLASLRSRFGDGLVDAALDAVSDSEAAGLVEQSEGYLRLTPSGRMVSNEIFGRILLGEPVTV